MVRGGSCCLRKKGGRIQDFEARLPHDNLPTFRPAVGSERYVREAGPARSRGRGSDGPESRGRQHLHRAECRTERGLTAPAVEPADIPRQRARYAVGVNDYHITATVEPAAGRTARPQIERPDLERFQQLLDSRRDRWRGHGLPVVRTPVAVRLAGVGQPFRATTLAAVEPEARVAAVAGTAQSLK